MRPTPRPIHSSPLGFELPPNRARPCSCAAESSSPLLLRRRIELELAFAPASPNRGFEVENLKALLEVETRVPLRQQQLHFNGKEMQNSEKLSAVGVRDGDLVMMVSSPNYRASQDVIRLNPDGSAVNPQVFQEHIRGDSQLMAQLLQALMYADPFNVDAQKKIEAAIRQKSIDENWEAALEHNPEAFARVVYIII